MELSAPTTITLRRPSADADLIISRHDDGVCGGGAGSGGTARDVTDRQVSYSDPGSASDSSPEGSRNALSDCIGQAVSRKKTKNKKKKTSSSTNAKGCAEGRLRCGVRRASDCLREAVKRCQQQLQLCNENKSKVNSNAERRICSSCRHLSICLSVCVFLSRVSMLRMQSAIKVLAKSVRQ